MKIGASETKHVLYLYMFKTWKHIKPRPRFSIFQNLDVIFINCSRMWLDAYYGSTHSWRAMKISKWPWWHGKKPGILGGESVEKVEPLDFQLEVTKLVCSTFQKDLGMAGSYMFRYQLWEVHFICTCSCLHPKSTKKWHSLNRGIGFFRAVGRTLLQRPMWRISGSGQSLWTGSDTWTIDPTLKTWGKEVTKIARPTCLWNDDN